MNGEHTHTHTIRMWFAAIDDGSTMLRAFHNEVYKIT